MFLCSDYTVRCAEIQDDRNNFRSDICNKKRRRLTHCLLRTVYLFFIGFSFQSEVHRALEVLKVLLIAAHCLAHSVGQLRNRSVVYILELDNDVESLLLGIIGAECSDAEGNFCLVAEVIVELLCAVKIKAVAEQQQLSLGINAVLFVVSDHLLAPLIGIAAVVADACVVVYH